MFYSRDRETTPVTPTARAFVPISGDLGLLAETTATEFNDYNYLPDLTKIPPVHDNPFAAARISHLKRFTGSNLNINLARITTPTGIRKGVRPVIDKDGDLIGARINDYELDASTLSANEKTAGEKTYRLSQGSFEFPGTELEDKARTGPTGSLTFAITSDPDYPLCSAVFQQRRIFAGGAVNGTRVWGSRVANHTDFSLERVPTAAGPWQFDIDVSTQASILHMIPVPLGLLLFTNQEVWLLTSGAPDQALTATQNQVNRQSAWGCSETIPPLIIANSVYYFNSSNTQIIALQYSNETRQYSAFIQSRLVSHIMNARRRAVNWQYSQTPHSRLFITLDNGAQLLAYVNEDNGTLNFTTQGLLSPYLDYKDVSVQRTLEEDSIYYLVDRHALQETRRPPTVDYQYSRPETISNSEVLANITLSMSTHLISRFETRDEIHFNHRTEVNLGVNIVDERVLSLSVTGPLGDVIRPGSSLYVWSTVIIDRHSPTATSRPARILQGQWTSKCP